MNTNYPQAWNPSLYPSSSAYPQQTQYPQLTQTQYPQQVQHPYQQRPQQTSTGPSYYPTNPTAYQGPKGQNATQNSADQSTGCYPLRQVADV